MGLLTGSNSLLNISNFVHGIRVVIAVVLVDTVLGAVGLIVTVLVDTGLIATFVAAAVLAAATFVNIMLR